MRKDLKPSWRYDDADRAGMAAMKAAGKPIDQIAKRFCCAYSTVTYQIAQHYAMQRAQANREAA